MKRYYVLNHHGAGIDLLQTDDVNEAFDFAYQDIEHHQVNTAVSIPALKQFQKGELVKTGTKTMSYEIANLGTLGFTITDTFFNIANLARKAAVGLFEEVGEIEFDKDAAPVKTTDEGWKVQCWVWVSAESAGMEDLDEDADEDNVEAGYIAAADHPLITFEDAVASLGDEPGAFVSGWVPLTDEEVSDYDRDNCASWAR